MAVVGMRLPWLDHQLWNLDEGSTFTMAQQVLEGEVLYRDAADNRSPLMPYLKAAIFAIFGDWNATAVHWVLAFLIGGCAVLVGWIGRRTDSDLTGVIAAATFALLQLLYVDAGDAMSANTEWFVVVFSTTAFALFVAWIDRPTFRRGLPVGFLLSLSILCKQPGLLDAIVVTVLLALIAIEGLAKRDALLRFWLGLMVGIASPMALTVGYFVVNDAYDDYIFYAFTFNTKLYLPEVPFVERLLCVRMPFIMAWQHVSIIGLVGVTSAVGLLLFVSKRLFRPRPTFPLLPWLILGWTFSGLLSTTLSGREFAHYSEQVIPGLSLAVGWIGSRLFNWRPRPWPVLGRSLATIVALAVVIQGVIRYQAVAAELSAAHQQQLDVGIRVRQHSTENERLFVWGYFPEIYFHSRRMPATRFIYTNYITGMIAWTNIDSIKDVEYGVSPGGWDKFYEDWAEHPPDIIVDTGTSRNHAKFPIEARIPLWSDIERNYAQVSLDAETISGMRLFRRLAPIPSSSAEADLSPLLLLKGYASLREGDPARLEVQGPPGFTQLDLVVNGETMASLPYPADQSVDVRFFIPGDAFTADSVRIRAHSSNQTVKSLPFDFAAFARRNAAVRPRVPELDIEGTIIKPTAVYSEYAIVPAHYRYPKTRELIAPARLVFDCPAGVDRLTFIHGLMPSVLHLSDGYDVTINWLSADGSPRQQIWQRRLQPRQSGRDQMTQEETIALPKRKPGQLEFRFTTGELSDPNNDHLIFGQLRGYTSGPNITFGSGLVTPTISIGPDGNALKTGQNGQWLAHVPSRIEWSRPTNLMTLSFDYGIEAGAYDPAADGHSSGVQFLLELVAGDGTRTTLFDRLLEPFNHAEQRGPQSARVTLPRGLEGTLVFSTGAGRFDDTSWDWAFAGNFRGVSPGPPLVVGPERQFGAIHTSGFENGWSDQFDATHWGAQSPQELVYPKPVDLEEVTFTFGLNDNAARDENGQRRSDGVEVVLVFASNTKVEAELFRRHLDPFTRPEDAGPQTATVMVPLGEPGTLKLRMEPGPNDDNSYDWAFWGPFSGRVYSPDSDASP